jgi:hypothetical protein
METQTNVNSRRSESSSSGVKTMCARIKEWRNAVRAVTEFISAAEYLLFRVGLLVSIVVFLILYLKRH